MAGLEVRPLTNRANRNIFDRIEASFGQFEKLIVEKRTWCMRLLLSFFMFLALVSQPNLNNSCSSNESSSPQGNPFDKYRQVRFRNSQPLDHFLENIVRHYRLPGIAAAIVSKDSILQLGAVGRRRFDTETNIEIDDIFCIGSCAKSMTAVLAATLVEEGVLAWDTRVTDVFQGLAGGVNKKHLDTTLKELLSHQTGIRSYYSDSFFHVNTDLPFVTGAAKEQRRKFAIWQIKQEPSTQPGNYTYSNGGYVVAAAMMEELTGQPWEELIEERLFKPLEMHSAFIGMPYQKDKNQPWRHYHRDEDGQPLPLPLTERQIPELFNPAGTVSLSIKDFARYAMFHLRGLAGVDGVLKSETIRDLHEPLIESEPGQFYSLGWGVRWYGDVKVSGHSGGDQSVYATIAIDHQNLMAGVVLCNIGDDQAESACANVLVEIMP